MSVSALYALLADEVALDRDQAGRGRT